MNASGEAVNPLAVRAPTRASRWRGWVLSALVVLLLLAGLEAGHRLLETRSQAPLYRVIVAGESLTLEAEAHAAFSRDLERLAAGAEADLAARMAPWTEARLEQAFAPLEAAVPGYLDWYFSLRGSYLRMAMGLAGDQAGWRDAQRRSRLIEASGIEAALGRLEADHAARLAREQQAVAEQVSATLLERYAPRSVADAEAQAAAPSFDLDGQMDQALLATLDTRRWQAAALSGGGLGLLAGRPLARKLSAGAVGQGGRMALRALATRLGAGAARSLASGGAAAAVTAPTGPGALMVGAATAAAGLAGMVGGEVALLRLQEARRRPALEARLHDGIEEARRDAVASLDGAVSAAAARLASGLEAHAPRHEQAPGEAHPEPYRIIDRLGPYARP